MDYFLTKLLSKYLMVMTDINIKHYINNFINDTSQKYVIDSSKIMNFDFDK